MICKSILFVFDHRRRKILKAGGEGGGRGLKICVHKTFLDHANFRSNCAHFERSTLLRQCRQDFLHKRTNCNLSQVEQVWVLLSHILMPS